MIKLVKSGVEFSETPHRYTLDGKELSGITSLIHAVLHLGVYEDVSDYVKNCIIPRAGDYGSCVHKAIEFYDVTGLLKTDFEGKYATYDLKHEIESYKNSQEGFTPLANEYTISDNIRYASNIDNVWFKNSDGSIWLFDTKTNNLQCYPGGKDALKEYLSWQLSIYARLFEKQNPELKVSGLGANWIRHEESEQWIIERKPDDLVDNLLSTPWHYDENNKIVYEVSENPISTEIAKADDKAIMGKQAVDALLEVTELAAYYKNLESEMKDKLLQAMKENGVKSWDAGAFKATYTPPTTAIAFDSKKFKEENEALYNQYCKESQKKESIRITIRKEK